VDPVGALVKSLHRDQVIVLFFATFVFFVAAFSGLAVELKFVSPTLRQFIPLIYTVGLIASSHGFLTLRLINAVKTLAALSKSPRPE